MTAILLIHFGTPRNKTEIGPFLEALFSDPANWPFENKFLQKVLAKPIALAARRSSIRKYESVGFNQSSAGQIEKLRERLIEAFHSSNPPSPPFTKGGMKFSTPFEKGEGKIIPPFEKGGMGGFLKNNIFIAVRYGKPSIEEAFERIDRAGTERITVLPLYPHASIEMYDSLFKECHRLRQLYYRNFRFAWAGAFYDHPLFISAWTDSIETALRTLLRNPPEIASSSFDKLRTPRNDTHLLFSAHALPIPPRILPLCKGEFPPEADPPLAEEGVDPDLPSPSLPYKGRESWVFTNYQHQVECTAQAIWQSLGSKHPMSIAYQSRTRFGRWSSPSLEDEIHRLAKNGVSHCLIVPISFLFDNVETLIDIDRVAMPLGIKTGMHEIRRARPPGDSQKIVEMIVDIVKNTSPL
jgi:ferrochelatase